MAMKLPIIISVPEGEATEIVRTEDLGLVIPPENSNSFAQAIHKIYKDKNLYCHLADNSYLAANKYKRKTLAVEMLEHIEKLAIPSR